LSTARAARYRERSLTHLDAALELYPSETGVTFKRFDLAM
jgi:hypothetical protein